MKSAKIYFNELRHVRKNLCAWVYVSMWLVHCVMIMHKHVKL